jgi:hypothetical protein
MGRQEKAARAAGRGADTLAGLGLDLVHHGVSVSARSTMAPPRNTAFSWMRSLQGGRLGIAQARVVVIDVAQDQQVTLEMEGESEMLIEPGLKNLPARNALDLLGMEAGVVGILGQEF